jgi:hypothetical protein
MTTELAIHPLLTARKFPECFMHFEARERNCEQSIHLNRDLLAGTFSPRRRAELSRKILRLEMQLENLRLIRRSLVLSATLIGESGRNQ